MLVWNIRASIRVLIEELDRRIRLCINATSWKSFQYDVALLAYQRWNSDRGRYNIGIPCKL